MTHTTDTWEEEFDKKFVNNYAYGFTVDPNGQMVKNFIRTLRKDWLRSEIEKLEGMRRKLTPEEENTSFGALYENIGHNDTLTSIITRYKEELKVLEGKYDK